jgi:hypothetical protein
VPLGLASGARSDGDGAKSAARREGRREGGKERWRDGEMGRWIDGEFPRAPTIKPR